MRLKRCACGYEGKQKVMKRIKGEWVCKKCNSKRKKEHREFIKRDILHIRKRSDIIKEAKKKRLFRKAFQSDSPPKIKGQKEVRITKQFHFFLTTEEKQVLFKKYHKMGLDSDSIKEKLKQDAEYLKNYLKELKIKEKSDEELNKKFKEEFAKLCMVS